MHCPAKSSFLHLRMIQASLYFCAKDSSHKVEWMLPQLSACSVGILSGYKSNFIHNFQKLLQFLPLSPPQSSPWMVVHYSKKSVKLTL